MADPVKLTIDGKAVTAKPGTLVIDAAKTVGIEIPAFCYYEGLSLAAACRTVGSLSTKLLSGDLSSKRANLFRTSWLTLCFSVEIAWRRA